MRPVWLGNTRMVRVLETFKMNASPFVARDRESLRRIPKLASSTPDGDIL